MADTNTPLIGFTLIEQATSDNTWGDKTNANWTLLDSVFNGAVQSKPNLTFSEWKIGGAVITVNASELNRLDGITATTAELNILDGVTATAAEINKLDGVTATTAELNYIDGVTSSIQTQLNDKAPLASPALTGNPTAPTQSAGNNTTRIATTAFVQAAPVGADQSWQAVGRSAGTSYQNTTGKPIQVAVSIQGYNLKFQASSNGSTWVNVGTGAENTNDSTNVSVIIPNGHYYRAQAGTVIRHWSELR